MRHDLLPDFVLRRKLCSELQNWEHDRRGPFPHLLKHEILRRFADEYGLRVLVETGTYYGTTIDALKLDFSRIYSIELDSNFYLRAKRHFRNCPHIVLLHGNSATYLPGVVSQLMEPALFWLDAHYSGGLTARAAIDTPIVQELTAVFSSPRNNVILIDDAHEFTGQRGYPMIDDMRSLAAKHGYSTNIKQNIIRLVTDNQKLLP
jgi:hypothetical protein